MGRRPEDSTSREPSIEEALAAVAALNEAPIEPERLTDHANYLTRLRKAASWEDEPLGFSFRDGRFSYVPPAVGFVSRQGLS